jgi:NAD(P)-dependent dehydrogenase (short-subunit alcohol dehydrogenase family)
MPTVLITGASRGLGLEFARQYANDAWRVIATCRDPAAAADLKAVEGAVDIHALDVTDHKAIRALARTLEGRAVDLLINNAGIFGPDDFAFGDMDYGAWAEVIGVNTLAPYAVTECFAGHVAASDLKTVVAVTSRMGSIASIDKGSSCIYRSSKAALNAVMKGLSHELKALGITVAVLHPGWVKTDMGGPDASIDAPVSVSGLRQVIAGLKPGDSGKFFNYDGDEIPW